MQQQAPPNPAAVPADVQPGEGWLDIALRIGSDVKELTRIQRAALQIPNAKAPVIASGVVPASGTLTLDLGSPAAGREWEIRRLLLLDASNTTGATSGGLPVASSGTFAAGAAGSSLLPAGASVTGFDVNVLAPGAAVNGLVTVTGLASGNQNYEITEQTVVGANLSIRYPNPLPASSAATTPQVNMPVIAGGAAYSMAIYGTTAVTGATPGTGWWYVGIPSIYGPQTGIWPVASLPNVSRFGGENISVPAKDRLFAVVTGATPGHVIVAVANVVDTVPYSASPVQPI